MADKDGFAQAAEAEEAAREFYGLAEPRARRQTGGRVNETFRLESGGRIYILQRLSGFFRADEALGENWRRLAERLDEGATPPLIPAVHPARDGRYVAVSPGRPEAWRLTDFRPGRPAPKNAAAARAAARALGSLHQSLNRPAPLELRPLPEGEFTNRRLTAPADLDNLARRYRGHPHLPALDPLLEKAAEAAGQLPLRPGFLDVFSHREVIIHGDPKADNFLWDDGREEITAVLDWDTAGLGQTLLDVGEMLRSFGAAARSPGELETAAAVVEGFAETGPDLTEADIELLPAVWRALALNLSRRYLTDALAEEYFQWDRRAYPSLYEQNRLRAGALLELAENLLAREVPLGDQFQAAGRRGRARRPY